MDTLKVARIRADVKLGEATMSLGVEAATLWRWETGRSPIPGWALLHLANLYDVDPRTLNVPRPRKPAPEGGDR